MPVVAKDVARQQFMKHFLAECLEVIAQPEGHGARCYSEMGSALSAIGRPLPSYSLD